MIHAASDPLINVISKCIRKMAITLQVATVYCWSPFCNLVSILLLTCLGVIFIPKYSQTILE